MALKSRLNMSKKVIALPKPGGSRIGSTPKAPSNPGGLMAAAPAITAAAQAVMPVNPQFGADVNAASRNLDTTLQQNQAARGQLGSSYGFGVDAAGNAIDDHTNPWSKAAALQTSYDNSVRGTTNSYASRGQLYSGAIQNAQDWNARQNLQSRDVLIREFMGARQSLDSSDLSAKNAYSSAVESAQAAAAQYALEQARAADTSAVPQAAAAAGPNAQARANAVHGGAPKITSNYKAPSGARGSLKVYPDGTRVFVPN